MDCQVCGTQLPAEAKACPNCGTLTPAYYTNSGASPHDPTTPAVSGSSPFVMSAPPPPTQYGANPYDMSLQSPYPVVNPYEAPPPPPPQRPGNRIGIILGVIILVLILIGGGVFAWLAYSSSPSSNTTTPNTISSPTPTPQVVPINQTMSCTNCSDPALYNFSLLVRNATIDSVNSQVTLLIGVQNISTTSRTGVFLTLLSFQDPQTGVTTNGAGGCFSSFDIAGQSTYFCRPTFQFVPVAGRKYSFLAELSAEVGPPFLFSPITIPL